MSKTKITHAFSVNFYNLLEAASQEEAISRKRLCGGRV